MNTMRNVSEAKKRAAISERYVCLTYARMYIQFVADVAIYHNFEE
jgi:hypothetical protein